jgi:hypothetical protein
VPQDAASPSSLITGPSATADKMTSVVTLPLSEERALAAGDSGMPGAAGVVCACACVVPDAGSTTSVV